MALARVALLVAAVAPAAALLPANLVQQEEGADKARLSALDDWCSKETAGYEGKRMELVQLQNTLELGVKASAASLLQEKADAVAKQLTEQHSKAAAAVEEVQSHLALLDSEVAALSGAEQELSKGEETPALQAVRKLLSSTEAALLQAKSSSGPPPAQQDLALLQADHRRLVQEAVEEEAKKLAVDQSKKFVAEALGQANGSLAELRTVCTIGRKVLSRVAEQAKPIRANAVQLLMQLESTNGALAAASRSFGSPQPIAKAPAVEHKIVAAQQQTVSTVEFEATTAAPEAPLLESEKELQLLAAAAAPAAAPTTKATTTKAAATTKAAKVEAHKKATTTAAATTKALPPPRDPVKPKHLALAAAKSSDVAPPKDWPGALRGGWRALMAQKKAAPAKPEKPDQSSQIMALVQTPSVYTAWKPSDTAVPNQQSLLQAAEQAFDDVSALDVKHEAKKGGKKSHHSLAVSFLQTASESSSAKAAAAVVLKHFAKSLESPQLLQLANSELSAAKLRSILAQVEAAEKKVSKDQAASQANEVCKAFHEDEAKRIVEAQKSEASSVANRAQAEALTRVVKARQEVQKVLGHSVESLQQLQTKLQQQAAVQNDLIGQMRAEARQVVPAGAASPVVLASLYESLGQLQTLATESEAELEDAISAASHRHEVATRKSGAELQKMQSQLETLKVAKKSGVEALVQVGSESEADKVMRKKLEVMCKAAVEQKKALRTKEEGEKEALRKAIAVLSA